MADADGFLTRVKALYERPDESSCDEIVFADGRVYERHSIPHRVGGAVIGRVWSFSDITDERRAQRQLTESAHRDALTGVANRKLFIERVGQALARATRHGTSVAILFIDLNGFKQVNDQAGHGVGDIVLVHAATRLRESLRDTDLVARLGGDEFVILIENCKDASEAAAVASKSIAVLSKPYTVGDAVFALSASAGVAIAPQHGTAVEGLLKSADAAMYRAKRERQGAFQFAEAA